MRRCNLEYVYIRLTESLLCSLENTKKDGGKVTLVCEKERNPKIVVNISGVEAVYELEPDHSSTYFPLINVKKSVGRFLGNIQYRYKTKATDDSFVRVRENLLEEVENSRQQKIKVQDYQLKSASLIKDKRNTKVKKNLNRNSVSGPALKMAKVSKAKRITKKSDIPSKISSPLDKNSKTKTDGETRDSPKISSHSKLKPPVSTKTKPRAKKVQQNATKSSKTSKESLKEIEATIRSKCISAIQRRTALEQRLREAYEKTDLCKRDKEIEDIKIDLCALVDELFNDELLRKWIPVSVGSI